MKQLQDGEHDRMSNQPGALESALESALAARTDLDRYGSCKRALFALEIATDRAEDIHLIAADYWIDGPDDKSVDILYVDRHHRIGYLIQAYEAVSPGVRVNKVATLNQAAVWVFGKGGNQPPARIRAAVDEVRQALDDCAVDEFQIWFVHNLPPETNVDKELLQAAESVKSLLNDNWPLPDGERHRVRHTQIGLDLLAEWYAGTKAPILADDEITLRVSGCYQIADGDCRGVATSVSASWLSEQMWLMQSAEDVFSANIRSYLGEDVRRSKINSDIQKTLTDRPGRFWFYNNGITALVHDFTVTPSSGGSSDFAITIKGISIVNGAQTAGVIKSAMRSDLGRAQVPIRFIAVENQDPETVKAITRYTNRQNATEPADFRSNDRHQVRLIREFEAMAIHYDGARRGGLAQGYGPPDPAGLKASNVGRALAAFHGDPGLANWDYTQIWDVEAVYRRFFGDHTSARHILLTTSLITAITGARDEVRAVAEDRRTPTQSELVDFFAYRGSIFLAAAGIGKSMEEIVGKRVDDPFSSAFHTIVATGQAVEAWKPILASALCFAPDSLGPVYKDRGGFRDSVKVAKHAKDFRRHVAAVRVGNACYSAFADLLVTAA